MQETSPWFLSEADRYGIHAMQRLIMDMLKPGTKGAHVHTKVFGDGSIYFPSDCCRKPGWRERARNPLYFDDYSVQLKKIATTNAPDLPLTVR